MNSNPTSRTTGGYQATDVRREVGRPSGTLEFKSLMAPDSGRSGDRIRREEPRQALGYHQRFLDGGRGTEHGFPEIVLARVYNLTMGRPPVLVVFGQKVEIEKGGALVNGHNTSTASGRVPIEGRPAYSSAGSTTRS